MMWIQATVQIEYNGNIVRTNCILQHTEHNSLSCGSSAIYR
jgi:hypothetical protein